MVSLVALPCWKYDVVVVVVSVFRLAVCQWERRKHEQQIEILVNFKRYIHDCGQRTKLYEWFEVFWVNASYRLLYTQVWKKNIFWGTSFFWNSFTRYKRNCRERRARTKVYNTWTCPWHEDVTMTDILVQERMNSLLPRMTPVMVVWFVMHFTFGAYCTTKHI